MRIFRERLHITTRISDISPRTNLVGVLVALINEGLNPVVLIEGNHTSRLDIIKDVPEGKVCYPAPRKAPCFNTGCGVY
jgi:hypothetical protein